MSPRAAKYAGAIALALIAAFWACGQPSSPPDAGAPRLGFIFPGGGFVPPTQIGSSGGSGSSGGGLPFNAASFGAAGDGAANDYSAINSAIIAAGSAATSGAYGSFVYLPRGVYKINSKLVLPNGVGLRGDGPSATTIIAGSGFSDTSMVTNASHTGSGDEYAFIEALAIQGNSAHATESVAVVDFDSLFVNSYIRDVLISGSSSVGLHLGAFGTPGGAGPMLIENTWVFGNTTDNVVVDEDSTNTGAVNGIHFVHLVSENQGSGHAAVRVHGLGHLDATHFDDVHIEMGSATAGTGTTGITLDGAPDTILDEVQLLASPVTGIKGVEITSAAANVREHIRNISNNNGINPVLNDDLNVISFGAVNLADYPTILGTSNTAQTSWSSAVGSNVAAADSNANLKLVDTTSSTAGVGGAINFLGNYTGTSGTNAAQIKASKSNATAGDFSFDLLFSTRNNGAGDNATALTLFHDLSAKFAGALTVTGALTASAGITSTAASNTLGEIALGVLAPASVTGTIANWSPTGLGSASIIVPTLTGNSTFTGLTGGVAGRLEVLCNTSASFNEQVRHLNAGSTATNQFSMAAQSDWFMSNASSIGNECLLFFYDSTRNVHQQIATTEFPFIQSSNNITLTGGRLELNSLPISDAGKITLTGQIDDIGTAPTFAGCGTTGASVTGGAFGGTVVTTTGATSCVLTLSGTLSAHPHCSIQDRAGGNTPAYTPGTTTFTFTPVAGHTYDWGCQGHQ